MQFDCIREIEKNSISRLPSQAVLVGITFGILEDILDMFAFGCRLGKSSLNV